MSALSCLPLTPPLSVSTVYRLYPNIDNGQIINNEMVNKKRFSTEFAVGKRGMGKPLVFRIMFLYIGIFLEFATTSFLAYS
jgi:hypothetical protein